MLGTLDFDDLTMFWTEARFHPTLAFEPIRPLFAAELAAGGDLETLEEVAEWERAWAAVEALGLVLDRQDGSAPIPSGEFILHIWPDGAARFRV